ncbi:MAG: AAA family ATPase [Chloroflexi bacterium]|nr:AAA family ATPase [Chloroflexota bacterium]
MAHPHDEPHSLTHEEIHAQGLPHTHDHDGQPLSHEELHAQGLAHAHDDDHQPSAPGTAQAIVDPKPIDYRDARIAAALLSAELMHALHIEVGDIIRITTERERSALTRVIGAHPEDVSRTIRFDRFARQNLKAYPHEEVSIERVELPPASQVVLVPGMDVSMLDTVALRTQLKELLSRDGTPLREGTLLYAKPTGALAGITYEVHSVSGVRGQSPRLTEGEAIFTTETALYLEMAHDHTHEEGGHQHQNSSRAETVLDTTYEDVGGLQEQIRAVREFVELPLLFPQVYRQLGMHPPRGVIFYGAPGTGKTLLARSVANEVNAHFYYINGPEIVGTFSGETEENLRTVFREATLKPPSIIFVDELDAIAPRRGTTASFSDTRAVTQLLSLMDGLQRAESVMVIGTTNRIEAIDPALRRAGRFDREVYFPSTSPQAREEILRVQTRDMPLAPDAIAALPEVAARAYGYVGADVMELAREAGLNALRRASQRFIDSPSLATYPASEDLIITKADFETALAKVRPASLRESLISVPTTTWDDIGGLASIKQRLRDLLETPLRHPEAFARLGLATTVGVLLYGPPGSGKTLLAKAIAREIGVNFIAIQGPELFSQWLGASEESVRHIFEVARRAAPCIIFFDQLDAIAGTRDTGEGEGTRAPQRVVNQLLSELDGMEERTQVVVIGATNHVPRVDPSILRPGRLGMHLYVGLPDQADRAEILRVHLRSVRFAPGQDADGIVQHLASVTEAFSGADLAFLCQRAKLEALTETGYDAEPRLSVEHFDRVLVEVGSLRSAV